MADLGFALTTSAWGVASALAVAAIGVVSLGGGKTRPRGAFAFGFFAIFWGLQIAFGNLLSVVSADVAQTVFLLFLSCSFPVNYLLVEFAVAQIGVRSPIWIGARFAAASIASLSALVLVFLPQLLVVDGPVALARGPLYLPLVILPQFAAFALALVALYRSDRLSPTPRTAIRTTSLLAGLGMYTGFAAAYYVVFYAGNVAVFGFDYLLIFVGLSAVALAVGIALLRRAAAARTEPEGRRLRLAALAILVPFAWGLIEGGLTLGPLPRLSTVGLWRIAGMAVIAYGLARWRLADLPQRTVHAAANGAGVSAAAASGVVAYGAGTLVTTSPAIPVVAGVIVLIAALLPGVRFARRLFARAAGDSWQATDESLYASRVDAYRAAVESSLARGDLDEDAEFLTALREKFVISDAEDRLLRHYARACVIAPREGDASAVYERLRLLGEGGAGRTWLARDRVRDRLVVLKEPLERWQKEPALRETVLREARLAARVRHANVIRIEEVLENRGAPVIVMEFAEGGSLATLLRARGVLAWRDAIALIVSVLRGVEAIHAAGILHRDLKPSNVLLAGDGSPLIADFGIAVAQRDLDVGARTVVQGATFVGTYAYLAPELRAGGVGDKRADIYACAAMLHECLYGSPPGLESPVLAQNSVPAELTALLARALAGAPGERPPSARAFAEELTSLSASPLGA